MTTIQADLSSFIQSMERRNFVICDPKAGTWVTRPKWMEKVYELLKMDDQRLEGIGEGFWRYLDMIERKPVVFGAPADVTEQQAHFYASVLRASEAVSKVLGKSKAQVVKGHVNLLAQKVAALQYRLEEVNGGKDVCQADPATVDKIKELAGRWKNKVSIFTDKALTSHEISKLERACQYMDFCSALFADKSLQDRFFSWTLRDNMDVDQFIQFPATAARVKGAFLAARLGRLGSEMFRMAKVPVEDPKNGMMHKVVQLPFDLGYGVEYINILNEAVEVNLHGTWRLTIKKILDAFSLKNKTVGDFEFFKSTGVTVWNDFELGRWNPQFKEYDYIDLTKEGWWWDLPVLEEITKGDLEKRYSVELKDGQWLICAKAGRQSPDLDLDNTHGFLEVVIPTESGSYKTYPFGNFAFPFPQTVQDLVFFIGDTREGKISYPDENTFYSHRQIASLPLAISPEQGLKVMRSIQKDLIKARFGINIFQFAGDNCACWAQTKLDASGEALPNLYKISIAESDPHNPVLALLFNSVKMAPTSVQPSLFRGLYTLFGGWRTYEVLENGRKVYRCQYNSTSCKEANIYHPGNLHELILSGKLKGVVTAGHK